MRDNNLESVYVKTVYDQATSGALTIDNAIYAADDYLHDGVINLSNVFLEQSDCYAKITSFTIRETITSGTLQKPDLKIYVFDTCDIVPVANADFNFADGTNTDIDNIIGSVTVANLTSYTVVKSGGSSYAAIAVVAPTVPIIVKVGSSNRHIPIIAITTATPTFDNSTVISITGTFELL
jgi:hypothetical protein